MESKVESKPAKRLQQKNWRREWDCVPTNFRNHSNNGKIVRSLCNRRYF